MGVRRRVRVIRRTPRTFVVLCGAYANLSIGVLQPPVERGGGDEDDAAAELAREIVGESGLVHCDAGALGPASRVARCRHWPLHRGVGVRNDSRSTVSATARGGNGCYPERLEWLEYRSLCEIVAGQTRAPGRIRTCATSIGDGSSASTVDGESTQKFAIRRLQPL
jgi:hypothetical protein